MKSLIFITIGQSEAATYGKYANKNLPERQNIAKSPAFQAAGYLTIASAGNASLACGYENQAFQAFCKKGTYPKLRF